MRAPGARLDAGLQGLGAAAREYARRRDRGAVRASLERVLEEAAASLPGALRQELATAAAGPAAATPLLAWIALLARSRSVLEADLETRLGRLREAAGRAGFLLDPPVLERLLEALAEDPAGIPDLKGLLDRRRGLSLVEAEIERRAADLARRYKAVRSAVAAAAGDDAAARAEAALRDGDLLPAAEALETAAAAGDGAAGAAGGAAGARGASGAGPADPLARARAALRETAAAAGFLAPEESAWVEAILGAAPAAAGGGSAAAGSPAAGDWIEALGKARECVEDLEAARRAAAGRIAAALGDGGAPAGLTGGRGLRSAAAALWRRLAAGRGDLEAARRRCLEAEWDLSRAVWDDGGLASAPALLQARRAFLECHRVRDLAGVAALETAVDEAGRAAARVRLEASWRRRWLERRAHAAGPARGTAAAGPRPGPPAERPPQRPRARAGEA